MFSAFAFLTGSYGTVYDLVKNTKTHIPIHFESHGTIYTIKNYFVIVFSTINFHFLANKQYPNTYFVLKALE